MNNAFTYAPSFASFVPSKKTIAVRKIQRLIDPPKNLVRDFLKSRYHFPKSRYQNFGKRTSIFLGKRMSIFWRNERVIIWETNEYFWGNERVSFGKRIFLIHFNFGHECGLYPKPNKAQPLPLKGGEWLRVVVAAGNHQGVKDTKRELLFSRGQRGCGARRRRPRSP